MNLAIVGAGMIVNDFFNVVNDLPEIKLKAIVGTTTDLEKMKIFQEKFNIENVYLDIDECLNNTEIDTVYVGVPNYLHYSIAKKALEMKKNVICEKPFTLKLSQAKELKAIALKNDVVLFEAITNHYLSNYKALKECVSEIGDIRIIQCNTSHYSSRYTLFREGTTLPVFNPKMGGGALMDINIYNIHFVVGLLGKPKKVSYLANVEKGIDTSGVLIMEYDNTKVVCVGAKDSTVYAPTFIQGNKGVITISSPINSLESFEKSIVSQESQTINVNLHTHRMYEEFKIFNEAIEKHDIEYVKKQLNHSIDVMEVVELALADANIHLG